METWAKEEEKPKAGDPEKSLTTPFRQSGKPTRYLLHAPAIRKRRRRRRCG
jgi:hypothetical protein